MKETKQDIPLEHLTDEQLDDFLQYTEEFTDEHLANIQERFQQQRNLEKTPARQPKVKKKKWLVLAVAASFLLLTAFTQMSRIRTIYYQLFGSHAEKILSNSDQLSTSVIDDGLKLTALASFRDTDSTYFLAELTDETADRLSEDTLIDSWRMNGGGNARVIDYNPDTKTATIAVYAIDAFAGGQNDYGFILNAFSSGGADWLETKDFDLTTYLNPTASWTTDEREGYGGGAIPDLEEKYGVTFEEIGAEILLPEEKMVVLSDDQQIFLSNIGYKDSLLHIQVKAPNIPTAQYSFLYLINQTTGEELQSVASFGVDYGTHNNETGRDDYEQYVFDLPKDELANYGIKLEGRNYATYQTGEWAIKLAEPQSLPAASLEDAEIVVGDQRVALTEITLTPLSLAFTVEKQTVDDEDAEPIDIQVQLKDGTTMAYTNDETFTSTGSNRRTDDIKVYGKYLDIEEVAGLTINGVAIALT